METSDTVLVLRTCASDGTSYGGCCWPESGPVECGDWDPAPTCEHGLHGLLWGQGELSHLSPDPDAIWLVVEVRASEVVDLGGAVKYPRGVVVYSGAASGAIARITSAPRAPLDASWMDTRAEGGHAGVSAHGTCVVASASGIDSTAATAGARSIAAAIGRRGACSAAGYHARATADGDTSAAAAAGVASTATAVGDHSTAAAADIRATAAVDGAEALAATAGIDSRASAIGRRCACAAIGASARASATGEYSVGVTTGARASVSSSGGCGLAASLGRDGRARAGVDGCIAVAWEDETCRLRLAVGYVGEDGILPDVWYVVEDGVLVAE